MVFRDPLRRPGRWQAADVASIAGLDDPARAAVFSYVAASGGEVSREQTAAAVGVTRRVAAFHLDRLTKDGWLDVSFRRLTGRTGPGAGRSSKLYRRSDRRMDVSVPPRNYELMARLLASAVLRRDGPGAVADLEPGVREFGVEVGAAARLRAKRNAKPEEKEQTLINELTEHGFEPFVDSGGVIRLRNCPYHDLARENTDLICALNLALMSGLTQGLALTDSTATLVPRDGKCCVAFRFGTNPPNLRQVRRQVASRRVPR